MELSWSCIFKGCLTRSDNISNKLLNLTEKIDEEMPIFVEPNEEGGNP